MTRPPFAIPSLEKSKLSTMTSFGTLSEHTCVRFGIFPYVEDENVTIDNLDIFSDVHCSQRIITGNHNTLRKLT